MAVTVAVLNAHALYWNLHRYTVGLTNQTINILLRRVAATGRLGAVVGRDGRWPAAWPWLVVATAPDRRPT